MKKIVISASLILLCGNVFPQIYLPVTSTQYGEHKNREKIDSSLLFPTGCGVPTIRSSFLKSAMQYFDSCNHKFYLYDPKLASWYTLIDSSSITPLAWGITGNTGTISGTNFIGTMDLQPIVLKTNNTQNGVLSPFGNIGFGIRALGSASDVGAIAIGSDALEFTTAPAIAIGNNALANHGGGIFDIAIGNSSQYSSTTGQFNVSIGHQTLVTNETSSYNTAIGHNTLNATTAGLNTAIGYDAMLECITGTQNVAIGMNALLHLTSGYKATATGAGAFENCTTCQESVANGQDAGLNLTIGVYNNYFGVNAKSGPSGSGNNIMGYYAGATLTGTANYNTFIGHMAGFNGSQKTTPLEMILIGAHTFGTADSTAVYGDSATIKRSFIAGKVGIGTKSPAYKLDVNGTGNFSDVVTITKNAVASIGLTIGNSNASGLSTVSFTNDNGSSLGQIGIGGTSVGAAYLNRFYIYGGSVGVSFVSANSDFRWYQGGASSSNETMRLSATNELQIGSSTDLGSYILQVTGDAKIVGNTNFGAGTIENFTAKYNVQSGTSYTLVAADAGKIISMNNGSAITLTVPASLPAGFTCTIVQLGAGQVTFTASSTTIHNRQSFTKTAGQYAVAAITMYTTDTFITGGDMQ